MVADISRRDAWRLAMLTMAGMLLLMLVLYQQSVFYLAGIWSQYGEGDYGHGYLVLAISAYLIYTNRKKLNAVEPCPMVSGVLLVILVSMFWAVTALVDIASLQSAALLMLVISTVWAIVGNRAMAILAFPLLYISFAIPVWFPLSPYLQNMTADVVFWIIRIMEVPAMRVENVIVVPGGKLYIEEACSGLRYLLASLTLGTLYAYLNYSSLRSRFIVVLLSAGAAVVANILRVLVVVYLGYKTDMQHPLVHDHLSLGWYIFAGVVALLLFIDVRVYKIFQSGKSKGETDVVVIESKACNKNVLQRAVHIISVASAISIGAATLYWLNNQVLVESTSLPKALIISSSDWSVQDASDDTWMPVYKGAVTKKVVLQNHRQQQVYLFFGIYPTQKQGEEVINEQNHITDDKQWHTQYQKEQLIKSGKHPVLEQMLVNSAGQQRLVWYWYRVAGKVTINKYQAKALQVLGVIQNKKQASVIAIAMDVDGDVEQIRGYLTRFIEQAGQSIDDYAEGE